jgi:hypothetical protein
MGFRNRSRVAVSAVLAASAVGLSLLALSSGATAGTVAAAVSASPNSGVVDGASSSVTGTAPNNVKSVVLIECDATQVGMVGSPFNAAHCDTTPADEVTLPVSSNAFSGSFVFHDPLTTGGAGVASCASGCVLIADNPSPGDVSSETMLTGNSCNGVFNGAATGSLVKTTSAGPNNSIVSPGQTITVTLRWNTGDFGGSAPSKTDDCVEIGSQISTSMSQEHKPGPSGGTDTFSYVVPSAGTNGAQVCDRGAVSGSGTSTEKSAILCYTVMATVTPEVSKALLLPVAGLLVGGGGFMFARRRRARLRLQD